MIESSLKNAVLDRPKFYEIKFSILLINYYIPGKWWALPQFLGSCLIAFENDQHSLIHCIFK